jgi:hypothetical protein
MTKLLNLCKDVFSGLLEGIQTFKTYKAGKVK